MAEDQEQSQKTEEPTAKRLEEARRKGDVASSREVQNWFMLLAATAIIGIMGPGMATTIAAELQAFLAKPHAFVIERDALRSVFAEVFGDIGLTLMLPMLILMVAAVLPPIIQHGFIFAPERVKPDLKKISLASGAKRLFSLRAIAELTKGLIKITIVGAVAVALVAPSLVILPLVPGIPLETSVADMHGLMLRLLSGVVAVLTLIAGLDFAYQRFEHNRKLRMSRQEVREELKQTEGDPHVRARLRAIRVERARQRMMQAVPEADVVITNPTHYAVALSYDSGAMAAPKLVAKGVDAIAQRIREVAEAHEVPIVENPPLARALHASVELDREIPTEHYEAVAQIIAYVLRLKGKPLPSAQAAR